MLGTVAFAALWIGRPAAAGSGGGAGGGAGGRVGEGSEAGRKRTRSEVAAGTGLIPGCALCSLRALLPELGYALPVQ